MCFSATASFVASGLLITGGAATLTRFSFRPKEWALAVIPLIFGLHQFSEGLVWLGIQGHVTEQIKNAAMYFYVFIALCFWPVYIPLAMLIYEKPNKKMVYTAIVGAGLCLSGYLFWGFAIYSKLSLNLNCCKSISYYYHVPWASNLLDATYVFLVVLPFLLSTNAMIRYVLGPCFFFSFLLALALQSGGDYPSIWCFLAAILSVMNYVAIWYPRRHRDQNA